MVQVYRRSINRDNLFIPGCVNITTFLFHSSFLFFSSYRGEEDQRNNKFTATNLSPSLFLILDFLKLELL